MQAIHKDICLIKSWKSTYKDQVLYVSFQTIVYICECGIEKNYFNVIVSFYIYHFEIILFFYSIQLGDFSILIPHVGLFCTLTAGEHDTVWLCIVI